MRRYVQTPPAAQNVGPHLIKKDERTNHATACGRQSPANLKAVHKVTLSRDNDVLQVNVEQLLSR
jgi:hypothetical protein